MPLQWEFKNERVLKCPLGISVDNDGNLYVACHDSINVVVISPDGQRHRQLLSSKDGLLFISLKHKSLENDRIGSAMILLSS
jgi:DNA-binding beta-propeller fold protein YncE